MTIGGVALSCCCDPESPYCLGIGWDDAPDTIGVSGSVASEQWVRAPNVFVGGRRQFRTQQTFSFTGTLSKIGDPDLWNTDPISSTLYQSDDIDYSWSVSQNVYEGNETGDSESGSSSGARFRLFCTKTGGGSFALGETVLGFCDGSPLVSAPYLFARLDTLPPFPPANPNGPPHRPSYPWQGVATTWPGAPSGSVQPWLNAAPGQSLSYWAPNFSYWVSTSLFGGWQAARRIGWEPRQSNSGFSCPSGPVPTEYNRCEYWFDPTSHNPNTHPFCDWNMSIVTSQALSVVA